MEGATIKTVFLFGRPGSGKGTQAKLLAEGLGWGVFSTGDKFKELRDGGGRMGERVRAAYDAGKLVPDWFPSYLYEDALLALAPEDGVVCEGFPRTVGQAELAHDVLAWLERPYRVLHLAVSEEESLRRMLERAKTEDRPDSNDEAKIRARFETYAKQTEPVLDFFRTKGVLTDVNGEQTREAILADIRKLIAA
ncbi:MAG: nucleoside monophosphate kinase [Patescibacteria group bacterium]|nr:nucleoside monophosphate kinase [Patescibacteria group bacterium]MDE1966331.1 nucleoside monophosphate kinase [Patescibacteria group bacterium]